MTGKLRRGPSDPMPQSGLRHGYENRRKLEKHITEIIVLMEHTMRHAQRALQRARGERTRDEQP